MLFSGHHKELAPSLETIGAAFAIFEWHPKVGSAELVSANRLFEQVTGRPVSESVVSLLSAIVPHYIEKQMRSCLEHCFNAQGPQEVELVIEQKGIDRWWRMVASPVVPDELTIQRVIVTLIEITEKKLLETELELARERYTAVVEVAYDGVISVDERQKITLINDAAKSIFGVAAENVVGTNLHSEVGSNLSLHKTDYLLNRESNSNGRTILIVTLANAG
jgi:PAS domain-containing protein